MSKKLELEMVRGLAGTPQWMRVIVKTLGMRGIRHKKVVGDTGAIRGMVAKVPHLVTMKEV